MHFKELPDNAYFQQDDDDRVFMKIGNQSFNSVVILGGESQWKTAIFIHNDEVFPVEINYTTKKIRTKKLFYEVKVGCHFFYDMNQTGEAEYIKAENSQTTYCNSMRLSDYKLCVMDNNSTVYLTAN